MKTGWLTDVQTHRQTDVKLPVKTAVGCRRQGIRSCSRITRGRVIKTTSTANLGATLADAGRQVLIVDCDPQANLSEASRLGGGAPGGRGSRTRAQIPTSADHLLSELGR